MQYTNSAQCPICGKTYKVSHIISSSYQASMKKDCECGAKLHTEVKENKVVLVISKDEEK